MYRRVPVQMWDDPRFTSLPRDAQLLLLFLRTGPGSTIIPGLSRANAAAAAAELKMERAEFFDAFETAAAAGLVIADWTVRISFIPQAVLEFPPENASVATAWAKQLQSLADCALKGEIQRCLLDVAKQHGSAIQKALENGLTQGVRNGFGHPVGNGLGVGAGNRFGQGAGNGLATRLSQSAQGFANGLGVGDRNGFGHHAGNRSNGFGHPASNGSANGFDKKALQAPPESQKTSSNQYVGRGRNGFDHPHDKSPETGPESDPPEPSVGGVFGAPGAGSEPLSGEQKTQEKQELGNDGGSAEDLAERNGFGQGVGNGMAHKEKEKKHTRTEVRVSPTGSATLTSAAEVSLFDDETLPPVPSNPEPPDCPHREIVELYHAKLPTLAKVIVARWPESQSAKKLVTRWREGLAVGAKGGGIAEMGYTTLEDGLRAWGAFFDRVAASKFLLGDGRDGWTADLHWLVCPTNFLKVLEGKYDNAKNALGAVNAVTSAKPSRLGVQPGDAFDVTAHFTGRAASEPAPEPAVGAGSHGKDYRALRFDGGLYVLAEDWVLLDEQESELVRETLDDFVPHGQVLRIDVAQLPRRVAQAVAMRRGGLHDRPDDKTYPLDLSELPAFPAPAEVSQRQEAA